MKKITKKMVTVVIAASVVALSPAQTFAKDPTPEEAAMESYVSNSVVGTWYGTWDEREAVVELKDDGDYYIRFTDDAKPGDVVFTQGKWYADNLSVSFLEALDKDRLGVGIEWRSMQAAMGKTMRNCLAVVRLLFLRLRAFCILNLYKIFDTKKGALLWVKCLQQRRE